MNLQEGVQPKAKVIIHMLQVYSFWIVLFLLCGFYLGIQYGELASGKRFSEAVTIGGMLYEGQVYDIKLREVGELNPSE